jgi:hypothetical protein
MASTIKVLSAEANLSNTASNVSFAQVVRIHNLNGATKVVTVKDSGGNTLGSLSVANGEIVNIRKNARDTLEVPASSPNVKAVKIAHSN